MKKFDSITKPLMWLMALLLATVVAGCGSGNGTADTTAPTVSSTAPVDAATGIALIANITATFSEAMMASTITDTTFTLKQGVTNVPGAVSYLGKTATFNPTVNLADSTSYSATLTTGVKDLAGNALAVTKTWSFTTGTATDTTAPTVSSFVPANNATGVAISGNIAVTFSETMNPSTITTSTLTLKQGTTVVPGAVSYSGKTAVFNPTSNLTASTLYTATVTTGGKDLADNALLASKTWNFTTGTTADITAPTVNSTIPATAATGVAVNANITAAFSEAMDPATVSTATFTLKQGTTAVPGAVTSPSTTSATFNPTSNLANNTTYTATLSTGVNDLAGNALLVTKTWSFTTVAAGALGPQPVDLGLAGNFVILAKTGVSTTGTTSVTGDIGVSPIDSTAITGFSLIADATNAFSTSSLVTGKIYAADYVGGTTSVDLTTAVLDMEAALTDAAGRTTPDFTELYTGDISGKTLVPGLYKWSTGVLITSAGVTLSGGANDVWIFQIAGNLTVANSAIVTLSPGVQSKNIFWQVSGEATLGTAADFKGIILSQTLISLNTGATINGRALAQTAVTLDANAVTQPAP